MARGGFFSRIGKALRHFWLDVTTPAPQPWEPPQIPQEPPSRVPPAEPPTTEPRLSSRRRDAFNRIMEWFPNDGEYQGPRGRSFYHSSQGVSNSPANPKTVRRNVAAMDELEVDLVLMIDREGFRQLASINPHFWYH